MLQPTTPSPGEPYDPYPRGEDSPAYRFAFQAWVVIFLLIICYSLAHYLGMWAKTWQ